jgi:uncharacterized protein DUF3500
MDEREQVNCPECDPLTRREFLKNAGLVAVTGAAATALPLFATPKPALAVGKTTKPPAETVVKSLYDSLTPGQREKVALPWSHPNRTRVDANWAIVDETVGEFFNADQQAMIAEIFKGVTAEEFHPKFMKQMQDDAGGIGAYHVALFGDPSTEQFEWVMTGRHVTVRAAGHSVPNRAFGGPIFYGHATTFNEEAKHPGNVFWYQAQRANAVYHALDGKQQKQALIQVAPAEKAIRFRGDQGELPGIPVAALSRDQRELVQSVMQDVLSPYRASDVSEVMRELKAAGGMEKLHLSFYKQDDLGNDGVWDIWRLEGPAFVWHFRGAPHVHTWVNIAASPTAAG